MFLAKKKYYYEKKDGELLVAKDKELDDILLKAQLNFNENKYKRKERIILSFFKFLSDNTNINIKKCTRLYNAEFYFTKNVYFVYKHYKDVKNDEIYFTKNESFLCR